MGREWLETRLSTATCSSKSPECGWKLPVKDDAGVTEREDRWFPWTMRANNANEAANGLSIRNTSPPRSLLTPSGKLMSSALSRLS